MSSVVGGNCLLAAIVRVSVSSSNRAVCNANQPNGVLATPVLPVRPLTISKRVGYSGCLPSMVPSQFSPIWRRAADTRLGGVLQATLGFGPSMSTARAFTRQGTSQLPWNSVAARCNEQVTVFNSERAAVDQTRTARIAAT